MSEQSKQWNEFYEEAWGYRKKLAEKFVELGVTDPFHLVEKLKVFETKYVFDRNPDTGHAQFVEAKFPNDTHFFPTGKPYFKYIHLSEQLHARPYYDSAVDFLMDYLDDRRFDAIVELGAGYGQNLIELVHRGAAQGVPMYAGEYTKSGVEFTNYLVSLNPNLPIKAFSFDYKNPDLTPVKEKGHILIFTSHSIEQVKEVSEDLFAYLSNFAERVTCIHFEPFGFQLGGEAEKGQASKFQEVIFKEKQWNANLAPVLYSCHQKKMINLTFVAKNVMGEDIGNPTSIAIWESHKNNL